MAEDAAQAPEGHGVTKHAPTIEEQPKREGYQGQNPPTPFAVPVRILEDPIEAERAKAREERSDKHDADDLKAQQQSATAAERAATAGEWQVIAALAGTGLAFLGTIGLLYTLKLTRDSLKINRDGLNLAKDTAEKELRAYVSVGIIKISARPAPKDEIIIGVRLKNHGKTPATEVKITMGIVVLPYPLASISDNLIPSPTSSAAVIFPEANVLFNGGSTARFSDLREQERGGGDGKRIYIIVTVIYHDGFTSGRRTQMCATIPPGASIDISVKGELEGGYVHNTPHNNHAT